MRVGSRPALTSSSSISGQLARAQLGPCSRSSSKVVTRLSFRALDRDARAPRRSSSPFKSAASVVPSSDGLAETRMPAASIAAILSSAPPLPPETIAPAWPMRRPGGAVRPAMKPTIGLVRPRFASSARNWAASSSAEPPISPIMMIDLVASSARNSSSTSMKLVPLTGSPPMPTAVVWPRPALVVWNTAS